MFSLLFFDEAQDKRKELGQAKNLELPNFQEVAEGFRVALLQRLASRFPQNLFYKEKLKQCNKDSMEYPPSQYGELNNLQYRSWGYSFWHNEINDLPFNRITDLDFSYCDFHYCDFLSIRFTNIEEIVIKGCVFDNVNFSSCTFVRYQFKNCRFKNVKFKNATLLREAIYGAFFENCILEDCDFSDVKLPARTFYNCSISNITLPDLRKQTGSSLNERTGELFGSISHLYRELAKGYKRSGSRNEEISALYSSKKYALYSECLGKNYDSSQCLKDIENWWFRIIACFNIVFKDFKIWVNFTVWVNYYVLGFALHPFRPLKWYLAFILLGISAFLLTGKTLNASVLLQFDAIFTYGKSLSDGPINWFQYGLFYLSSFVSLVLNGLFITAFFSYLTFNENYDS